MFSLLPMSAGFTSGFFGFDSQAAYNLFRILDTHGSDLYDGNKGFLDEWILQSSQTVVNRDKRRKASTTASRADAASPSSSPSSTASHAASPAHSSTSSTASPASSTAASRADAAATASTAADTSGYKSRRKQVVQRDDGHAWERPHFQKNVKQRKTAKHPRFNRYELKYVLSLLFFKTFILFLFHNRKQLKLLQEQLEDLKDKQDSFSV